MDYLERVAWNLRRIRTERGVSQEALAVDAEIDRTYVSRLERGMENPTVSVLSRLSTALDCDITAFFGAISGEPLPVLKKGRKRKQPGPA